MVAAAELSSENFRAYYNFRSTTMKNIIRAFVVALTLAGSVAYTQINASAQTKVSFAKVSSMPCPCCPPGDPNACGMDGK